MRAYRDALEHLAAAWQFKAEWAKVTDVDAELRVYETIRSAFAKTTTIRELAGAVTSRARANALQTSRYASGSAANAN